MYEIERKFLIEQIPSDLKIKEKRYIHQYYIQNKENIDIRVYSVIFENNSIKYYYSTKKGEGLIREEVEIEIDNKKFFEIIKKHKSTPIIKIRNFIETYNDLIIEIDNFINYPLILAEIEFRDTKAAKNFIIPNWFKEEKTNDIKYTNKFIWQQIQNNVKGIE